MCRMCQNFVLIKLETIGLFDYEKILYFLHVTSSCKRIYVNTHTLVILST